jgi:tRNA pseudouridine38-40 synthase
MTIAYDGTAYCGWQRQPEPVETVQRTLERAVGEIVSRPVTVKGSSRTDTGVHAMGQVAEMDVDTEIEVEKLRRAVNSRLPDDILIRSMEIAPPNFEARASKRKRYRYFIWADPDRSVFYRHFVYHFYQPIDAKLMDAACQYFVGEHDFESFKGKLDDRESTVRTIFSCGVHRRGPLVIFAVEGSGFLYHMVRTMVGTVLDVGRGRTKPEGIRDIIAAKDRAAAGVCAPAQGLCLQWIRF